MILIQKSIPTSTYTYVDANCTCAQRTCLSGCYVRMSCFSSSLSLAVTKLQQEQESRELLPTTPRTLRHHYLATWLGALLPLSVIQFRIDCPWVRKNTSVRVSFTFCHQLKLYCGGVNECEYPLMRSCPPGLQSGCDYSVLSVSFPSGFSLQTFCRE